MLICKTALVASQILAGLGPEARPEAEGYIDDVTTGVRCHYQIEANADLCDAVFVAFAEAREAQHGLGWPEPPDDVQAGGSSAPDVYLHRDAEWGAYVSSSYIDADPDDGRTGSASYMVLDPRITEEELGSYVAHEYNHMLQFAMDYNEPSLPPWEGAATRAEEVTYPGFGSAPTVVPDYQATPWAGALSDGYILYDLSTQFWSFYEYGSVLWFDDLREEHGVNALDFWWAMVQDKDVNEPDVLDAYEAVTGDGRQAFIDFGVRRAAFGTDQAPAWAAVYADAPLGIEGQLAMDGSLSAEWGVYEWGFIAVDVLETGLLSLSVDESLDWAVVSADTGEELGFPAVVAAGERVLIFNFGGPDYDGDDRRTPAELTVSLSAAPEDTGDSADSGEPLDTGEEPGPRGCGCSSEPGGYSGLVLLGLGLALLARRRAQ